MKNIIKIIILLPAILILATGNLKAQLVPSTTAITANNTPVIATCNLGSYGNAQISVPTEALTGDNIPLNITFPATSVNCVKKVTITSSSNLNFVSSVMAFVPAGPNVYTNSVLLDPINGQNFNVMYKFPNGIICNNASGTFAVEFEVTCGSNTIKCTANVTVKARAANYWSIYKQFITGNLTCGESYWRIILSHNNLNAWGLGAYNISGAITETTGLPIISGASFSPNYSCYAGNYNIVGTVVLENCQNQGTTITNTANYNLNLGGGCSNAVGNISAVSTPLASPNASISFSKTAWSNGQLFSNGCTGYYWLQVCNNGNTPWTNFTITDNLTIPGITVTSINLFGWTETPPGALTGPVTFTNPALVLNPGQCSYIQIFFTVTGPTSSTVTNTASLQYQGGGGSSGTGQLTGCPGINCPVINTTIQNTTATSTFQIKPAQAVPSIVKCNEPNPYTVPIKQVGNTIKFRILVGNAGSGPLTSVITDALNGLQNLSIVPGTVTFTYYPNQTYVYCGMYLTGTPPPSSYAIWNNNLTNPQFNINNLPGNCNLGRSNVLVIEFEANILPQLSGSKTNTAVLGSQSANANYTIDKTGILQIRKTASVSTVENGGSFFYTLTVTNMGSAPLNNVIVTDNLPSCIQRNGNVTVTKNMSSITNTVSSNVVITINPATVINPGESFIITIPVIKVSGTNCCNPSASATAKMVPDGTLINAVTPIDQPACVTSLLCCDIPRFQTTLSSVLSPTPGVFNLAVNGGPVPVQELEVSMLDYHVVYSSPACKPANMGIFGNIFSPNTLVGGLTINNNNSHSVGWGLGTPTILNNNIRLVISRPGIIDLPCCNGTMYFCLKIRIKNVNCDVCEKIVCGRFNLRSNIIIWDTPIDINPHLQVRIRTDLVEANEIQTLKNQQRLEIEDAKVVEAIEKEIKSLDPTKASEFLKRLGEKPKEVTDELKGKQNSEAIKNEGASLGDGNNPSNQIPKDDKALLKQVLQDKEFLKAIEIVANDGQMINPEKAKISRKENTYEISWDIMDASGSGNVEYKKLVFDFDGEKAVASFDELNERFDVKGNPPPAAKLSWPPKWWPGGGSGGSGGSGGTGGWVLGFCGFNNWSAWITTNTFCGYNYFCVFNNQQARYRTETRYCKNNPSNVQTRTVKLHCGC
jgi:uncharacterized repeat protein (TIGR01451 family)